MKQFNKSQKLTAILVIIVVFAGLISMAWIINNRNNKTQPSSAQQTDASRFAAEYKDVSSSNPFVYATEQQALELFNSGTGVIYLGFPECPWCQSLVGLINQAAQQESVEKVYYLNIRQARTDKTATYDQLVSKLSPYLDKDEAGQPRIYVPDVSFVKNGKIIERFEMEKAPESESKTADSFWTPERKARAITQLREQMHKLK